jgi:hypothetical protein
MAKKNTKSTKSLKRIAKVCKFKPGDLVWLPVPVLNETKCGVVVSSSIRYQMIESQTDETVIKFVHKVLFNNEISSFFDEGLYESQEEAQIVNNFWNIDTHIL